ncbi:MAG: hypothetical protein ACFB0B_13105 [Thermonemataceae bacterium]
MEKTLYQTEFCAISHDAENSLLFLRWNENSAHITDEMFRDTISRLAGYAKEHSVKGLLPNAQKFNFTIVPKTQEWHDTQIVPIYNDIGMKRLAFVVSEDLFSQVSIEQIFEEEQAETLRVNYFTNEESAIEWLNAS